MEARSSNLVMFYQAFDRVSHYGNCVVLSPILGKNNDMKIVNVDSPSTIAVGCRAI